MTNKVLQIESGVLIEGATPSVTLKDTDTTDLQHTISSSAGLVISADANNVEATTTIDFDIDGTEALSIESTNVNFAGTVTTSDILDGGGAGWLRLDDDQNSTWVTDTDNQTVLGSVSSMVFAADSNANGTGGLFYWGYGQGRNGGGTFTETLRLNRNGGLTAQGGVEANGTITANVDNATNALDLQIGTQADYIFTANSTSGYITTLNMDDVGLDIGHNSSSRALNLITNSLDRLTVAGGGNVGINNTNPTTAKLVVDGDDNTYTIRAEGGATAGQSYGMRIRAGSNASDRALLVENKAADTTFMEILGDGSVNINGNLTVTGTTTSIENTNTQVADQLMELGNGRTGAAAGDAGLIIERGDDANAFIGFDESADQFVVATTSATGASTGDLTLTDGDFRANQITTSYANNTGGVARNIYQSTSAPTSGDGQIGDLWVLYA